MMNWFKRHLNWTWVIFYTLTLCLAYSLILYIVTLPPPPEPKTLLVTPGHWTEPRIVDNKGTSVVILGEYVEGKSEWVTDENKLAKQIAGQLFLNSMVILFWFCPIYLLGTILFSRWVLKQKERKLSWIWLTLIFPITPLILENRMKSSIVSDLGQLQTSVVHRSGGYNGTRTHSDKTGDI